MTGILIAGTGGQGVLTAARLLTDFFAGRGHEVTSGQTHTMAQRGGTVQSTVIIDGGGSPCLGRGRAGFLLGFEPIETVRALPYVSPATVVFMNTAPVVPYVLGQAGQDYPELAGLLGSLHRVTSQVFTLDATRRAEDAGAARALNLVMLGALFGSGRLPYAPEDFAGASGLDEGNRKAFWSGVEVGAAC